MERQLPQFDLPLPDAEQLVGAAKDVAYVAIGFGVLTFQRAQVRRQELTKFVEARVGGLDDRVAELEQQLDRMVDRVAGRLPEPAAGLVGHAHRTAKTARAQVRSRLRAA